MRRRRRAGGARLPPGPAGQGRRLAELRSIGLGHAYPDLDPARTQIRLVQMAPALITPFCA